MNVHTESKIVPSHQKKNTVIAYIVLLVLLMGTLLCSVLFGAESINLYDLLAKDGDSGASVTKMIFMQIRLPRTLLAALTGILLAGAGATFQLYFRNPLAEPGIMGISSGATLGAVIVSSFSIFMGTVISVNIGAFIGALVAGLIVTVISGRKSGPAATVALLLCGTALGTFYSALTSLILAVKSKELHTMYMWMLGSFSGRGWEELSFIVIPAVISLILMFFAGRQLDLLSGGEMTAASLGVEVTKVRFLVMVAGSLASSAAVCAGGTIGFVGLIAPHIIRRVFGAKGRTLIPLSMIGGAALMLGADTIARVVARPAEIPVGTITALLGAPFFISLVFSKRGLRNG